MTNFSVNRFGNLGLGHCNAVEKPQIVKELCDKQSWAWAWSSWVGAGAWAWASSFELI